MAFRKNESWERIFVGPFTVPLFRTFYSELMEINPLFRWRLGLDGEYVHDYLALGYEEEEDLGVMSWGGYDDGYDDDECMLYSPQEFLQHVGTSNSRCDV